MTTPGCGAVQRKFWIAAWLTLPIVAVAMLPHLLQIHPSIEIARILRGVELLFSAP